MAHGTLAILKHFPMKIEGRLQNNRNFPSSALNLQVHPLMTDMT